MSASRLVQLILKIWVALVLHWLVANKFTRGDDYCQYIYEAITLNMILNVKHQAGSLRHVSVLWAAYDEYEQSFWRCCEWAKPWFEKLIVYALAVIVTPCEAIRHQSVLLYLLWGLPVCCNDCVMANNKESGLWASSVYFQLKEGNYSPSCFALQILRLKKTINKLSSSCEDNAACNLQFEVVFFITSYSVCMNLSYTK